ncbi:gag-pol polyprotein [Striga asiatica]|uniref:Gag-pol polyprotein n=1 Tax=Striga asiatica TaxID=4170 RepID=A0A5A7R453_STRAF|nr:gag-pol polyprotein [Striga asiatica]
MGGTSSAAIGFGQSPGTDSSGKGGGPRCFSCGETGHRQSACPRRGGSCALVTYFDFDGNRGVVYDGPPVFYEEPGPTEEHLLGDVGPAFRPRDADGTVCPSSPRD